MYRTLGWSRADCAEFLHLTERCLRNWEAGRRPVPFAAYKLLRLHLGYELPGSAWRGWSVSRGKLCTPEGHELSPHDAAWWSLLVRRAEVGARALRRLHEAKQDRQAAGTGAGVTGGGASGAPARGAAEPAPLAPETEGRRGGTGRDLPPRSVTRGESPIYGGRLPSLAKSGGSHENDR